MLKVTVRKSGGSLIMTIPQVYTEQNNIEGGEEMSVEIVGQTLILKPLKNKYTLDQLLAATPKGEKRLDSWLNIKPVGREVW